MRRGWESLGPRKVTARQGLTSSTHSVDSREIACNSSARDFLLLISQNNDCARW